MEIERLMSRNVQYCLPDDTLEKAAQLMWDFDCGAIPVCTGEAPARVIGMITDRDVCMSALFEGRPLRDLRVAGAMSRRVLVCLPSDRPAHVERVMRERQIRRVPVADESHNLLGIVSLADLARAAHEQSEVADAAVTKTKIGGTLAAICAPTAPHTQETAWRQTAARSGPHR